MEEAAKIKVARNGRTLGSFTPKQIEDGLKAGLFFSSDHYWRPGMKEWALLASLFPGLTGAVRGVPSVSSPSAPAKGAPGGWRTFVKWSLGLFGVVALCLIALWVFYYLDLRFKTEEDRRIAAKHYGLAVKAMPGLAFDRYPIGEDDKFRAALPHLKVAASKGSRVAQYQLGFILYTPGEWQDYGLSEYWMRRAASQGDPGACAFLSAEYCSSRSSYGDDVVEGLKWHFLTPESQRREWIIKSLERGEVLPGLVERAKREAAEFVFMSEYAADRK